MKPAYGQAAAEMKRSYPNSYYAAVDATRSPGLAQRYEVKGYPTLKYYENGDYKSDYNGGRTKENLVSFMKESKPQPFSDWLDTNGHQHVNYLDDSTFDNFIKTKKKVLVMFYAPCMYTF